LYSLEDSDAELDVPAAKTIKIPAYQPVLAGSIARSQATILIMSESSAPTSAPREFIEDYEECELDGAPLDAVLLQGSKKRKRSGALATPTMVLHEIRATGQDVKRAPHAKKVRQSFRVPSAAPAPEVPPCALRLSITAAQTNHSRCAVC
jgi:hypothetical protein